MKRILSALSILLAMTLSGCNSHKEAPMELADTATEIQKQETSAPTEIPTAALEPTQMSAEVSEPMDLPAEADETDSNLQLEVSAAQEEDTNIFHVLPSEFHISGAGAWRTIITLNDDGTFTGEHSDSEMGIKGEDYPKGTVFLCDFSGKFTIPQKTSDYVYSMTLESLEMEQDPGAVYYEDGIRYVTIAPAGFDNNSSFRIYLPGCPLEDVTFPELSLVDTSESYLRWYYTGIDIKNQQTIPSGLYVICNIDGTAGFRAEDEMM